MAFAWQVATPFGSVGHGVHELPHALASLFAAQVVPQRW
jgi:hypothetical protein